MSEIIHRSRESTAKVSIVIPAFNAEKTLTRTVDSVLAQTEKHWQMLIVDDGSTDTTLALAQQLTKTDLRITALSQKNAGVSAARNLALHKAESEWVLFLDADDWLAENALEVFLKTAKNVPLVQVIYSGSLRVLPSGDLLAEMSGSSMTFPDDLEYKPIKSLAHCCPLAIHSVLVKRETVFAAGLFDEALKSSEDWDLWVRVARTGAKFKGVKQALAFYFLRNDESEKNYRQIIADARFVLKRARNFDGRVRIPATENIRGSGSEDLHQVLAEVSIYFASVAAGACLKQNDLFTGSETWPDYTVSQYFDEAVLAVVTGLAVGCRQPHALLAKSWKTYIPYVQSMLDDIECASGQSGVARRILLAVEKEIISRLAPPKKISLDSLDIVVLDSHKVLPDFNLANRRNDVLVCLENEGKLIDKLWFSSPAPQNLRELAEHLFSRWKVKVDLQVDRNLLLQGVTRSLFIRACNQIVKRNRSFWDTRLWLTTVKILVHKLVESLQEEQKSLQDLDRTNVINMVSYWRRLVDKVQEDSVGSNKEIARHIPVLMYHSIAADGPKELAQWRLDPEKFAQQLQYLADHDYYSVNSNEIYSFLRGERDLYGKPVMLSFDDGYCNFEDQAMPLLKDKGFSAEVFLVTDCVGDCAKWDSRYGQPAPLMNWDSIRKLQQQGISFGSHLASHRRADQLSLEELVEESARSRFILEKQLNRQITSVAIPFGVWDKALIQILKETGYQTGFTTVEGHVEYGMNPLCLPRIEITGNESEASFAQKLLASPVRAIEVSQK